MQPKTSSSLHLQRRSSRDIFSNIPTLNSSQKRLGPTPGRKGTNTFTAIMISRVSNPRVLLTLLAVFFSLLCAVFLAWHVVFPTSFQFALCRTLVSTSISSSPPVLDHITDHSADRRRPMTWASLTHLVMVAGHAIYTGQLTSDVAKLSDESNWILEPFQHGQVSTFVRHIERGVSVIANDSSALLLFSGGQTRDGAGPRSEGLSYWSVANAARWFGYSHAHVQNRSFAEEYARDSFENILFSVCRFKQITGRYPRQITVIGFEFKRDRFTSLHRRALRYPIQRFQYVGVDPPSSDPARTVRERATAHGPFSTDPYGCSAGILNEKREKRNPYIRYHPYPQGCSELKDLFNYCGRSIFRGPLPWDPRVLSSSNKDNDINNDEANTRSASS